MKIKYWDKKFKSAEKEYELNTNNSQRLKDVSIDILAEKYTAITPENVKDFFSKIPNIKKIVRGKGLDLGGGPGILSAVLLNNYSQIEKITLVEVVESILLECFANVQSNLLKKERFDDLEPVCGSFDEINCDDESIDFCFAWAAMHHSRNLTVTLKEIHRVLKKGGNFLIVDRAHNNSTPQSELNRMMDVVYSQDFIEKNGFPIGTKLTRRENGEHEYRFDDWIQYFKEANFKIKCKYLFLENHEKNIDYHNDGLIEQEYVDYKLGGFEKKRIVFILEK